MGFEEFGLSRPLVQAVKDLGFEQPTPIQIQAIPVALQGRDVTGCAQTGTGKTAAFLLPALERLLQDPAPARGPRLLVLEPTRELAIQVAEQAERLTAHTRLRVAAVYGGAPMGRQTQQLRQGADVVVATPGRLIDHQHRGNLRLEGVAILVLDEADRMLDMGFLPDITAILRSTPPERQTLLFSATMPAAIVNLARQYQRRAESITIGIASPPEAIRQALFPVPRHLKPKLLAALLSRAEVRSTLVFTDTKREADTVARQLGETGIAVACLHADFNQRQRVAALERFRSGGVQVLVATNIASRGLDVEGISHVVNYDVPEQPEDYVHRIGRTARAEADGDALTLVTPDDEMRVRRIEGLLGYRVERKTLAGFDYAVPTPSWAKPSAKAMIREANASRSSTERWRSLSFGSRRR